jgi:hypothetical protein
MNISIQTQEQNLTKLSIHSGTARNMTFEAWMKEDKFKEQVSLPFKKYLKEAFHKHCLLRRQYHYLLSTADNSPSRKAMACMQAPSKANSDTALTSSAEGSISTNHGTGSSQSIADLPLCHSANEDEDENPTSTGVTSHGQRMPNPDDMEYIPRNEEEVEIGAADTSRSKSTRISEQLKLAKLTQEAM